MKKEERLVNKIKCLLRRAKIPRFLHHYGPKKYEFYKHAFALIIKQECKLSFRRVSKLFRSLGFVVPSYSALAKMLKRVPLSIWRLMLKMSNSSKVDLAAIDSTGLTRPSPSVHYIKRIDKPYNIETPFKLSILADVKTKKIIALRLRAKQRHDMKDVFYLLKRSCKINILLADKAYDSEELHEYAFWNKFLTVIPTKKATRKGFFRKKMQKNFDINLYNKRSAIETVFFMLKRKYGETITSLKFPSQRADLYCRAIAHNINSLKRNYIFN